MIAATDEDGRPVHIEIRMAKEGGVLRGLLDCLAASVCRPAPGCPSGELGARAPAYGLTVLEASQRQIERGRKPN